VCVSVAACVLIPHSITPSLYQALVLLLAEEGDALVLSAWKACEAVAATIPKENQVRQGGLGEGVHDS
jgi:hypothetical protein